LNYKADSVVFGSNRIGHAEGRAELRDGANGALAFTTDARNVSAGGVDLTTLTARLSGTRANHTFEASATGKLQDRPLDLTLAANGKLTEARDGTRWDGTVSRLQNKGLPALNLEAPLTVSAAPGRLTLGPTHLTLEGAVLTLKSFAFDHGKIQSHVCRNCGTRSRASRRSSGPTWCSTATGTSRLAPPRAAISS
jgi:translocation and assembly module TamB